MRFCPGVAWDPRWGKPRIGDNLPSRCLSVPKGGEWGMGGGGKEKGGDSSPLSEPPLFLPLAKRCPFPSLSLPTASPQPYKTRGDK